MRSAVAVPKLYPHLARLIALSMLLVACLWSAVAPPFALTSAQALRVVQNLGAGTGDPLPKQQKVGALLQGTPEEPTGEPQPTPEETVEPVPSETPELPPETTEPTPGEPEVTEEATPEPEQPTEPVPTEPTEVAETVTATATVTPTSTATPTATPRATATRTSWPLGTIHFGAEESAPPAEPVQVTLREWLRLALALVIVALVAILGGGLLYRLLGSVIKRQYPDVDEALLVELKPLIPWWLAAISFHMTILWVGFENEAARDLFADLAFLAYLGVATLTAWRLVDRAIDLYADRLAAEGHAEGDAQQAATVAKLRPIMRRWARLLILLFSGLVGLGRLQAGFSVPTLLVILLVLAVGLAARDTLADIIAGFFILIDQPFRVGDRVEVQGVGTWADVVSIGLRTSVLRTRHNVEIVVPNSTISENQVINYSYPDSRYRMQTYVEIAFGTDVERARQLMIDAVRQAGFVLPGEPVDVLYAEIGDSGMIFRVLWWIDFYRDWERAYDCVHTSLRNALKEADMESPYPSQSVNLQVDDRTLAEVWQAWQGEGGIELTE